MKKVIQILNVLLLLVAAGGVFYLAAVLKNGNDSKIELISFEGNSHLTKEQYLNYANLTDKNSYADLSIQIIKDRIEKHPYIERADVRFESGNSISIRIIEKKFDSILLEKENQYILTDDLQVLPVFPQTKKIDYPIISNPVLYGDLKVLSVLKKNQDIVTASKIISAIKLINPELYDSLSSIDLENGGDIVIYLSSADYPVKLGRGNELRKVVYLNNLWNFLKGKEINKYLDYVDLRYGGHVYLGISETDTEEGIKKS